MAFKLKYNKKSFPFKKIDPQLIKSTKKGFEPDFATSGAGNPALLVAQGVQKVVKSITNQGKEGGAAIAKAMLGGK